MQRLSKNSKKPLKTSWVVISLLLSACAGVPAPKGEGCVAFVEKGVCTNVCYDLEKDFDAQTGNIKKGAKASLRECSTEYFHKRVNFDAKSFASLKAYALKLKSRCEAK